MRGCTRALLGALVGLVSLGACDREATPTSDVRTADETSSPATSPTDPGCDLQAPKRVRRAFFRPPVTTDGDQARLRVTFLDGSRASLTYPKDLMLTAGGVRPDTTGGEPGGMIRPQISYGGIDFSLRGEPTECVRTRNGSLAGIWEHPDGRVLILSFGKWYVSVFDSHTDLDVWAEHLRGRVTRGGWLLLQGDDRLEVGPEQGYGDTSMMLGNLEPGVILWPLRCVGEDNTVEDVARGRGIHGEAKGDVFANWCDPEVPMRVDVYSPTRSFVRRLAAELEISDVRLTHPLSRYHVVP